jgi:hypothetical protein
LVQGSFVRLRRRIQLSVLFAATFTLGALATFRIASLVGALVRHSPAPYGGFPGVAAGLGLLSLLDLLAVRRSGYCPLSLRRQTPKVLMRRHGMLVTAALWGFDLGTMVSTFRVTAAGWGALLLVVSGWVSPWGALLYAAGFTAPLLFLMWTGRLPGKGPEHAWSSIERMLRRRKPAQWLSASLLALGVILIATGQLGPDERRDPGISAARNLPSTAACSAGCSGGAEAMARSTR